MIFCSMRASVRKKQKKNRNWTAERIQLSYVIRYDFWLRWDGDGICENDAIVEFASHTCIAEGRGKNQNQLLCDAQTTKSETKETQTRRAERSNYTSQDEIRHIFLRRCELPQRGNEQRIQRVHTIQFQTTTYFTRIKKREKNARSGGTVCRKCW